MSAQLPHIRTQTNQKKENENDGKPKASKPLDGMAAAPLDAGRRKQPEQQQFVRGCRP
jgi:hypothetical protein